MLATHRPMSLRRLATVLGVSQPFLSQIRAGKRPLPDSLRVRVEALGAYQSLLITQPQGTLSGGATLSHAPSSPGGSSSVVERLPSKDIVGNPHLARALRRTLRPREGPGARRLWW